MPIAFWVIVSISSLTLVVALVAGAYYRAVRRADMVITIVLAFVSVALTSGISAWQIDVSSRRIEEAKEQLEFNIFPARSDITELRDYLGGKLFTGRIVLSDISKVSAEEGSIVSEGETLWFVKLTEPYEANKATFEGKARDLLKTDGVSLARFESALSDPAFALELDNPFISYLYVRNSGEKTAPEPIFFDSAVVLNRIITRIDTNPSPDERWDCESTDPGFARIRRREALPQGSELWAKFTFDSERVGPILGDFFAEVGNRAENKIVVRAQAPFHASRSQEGYLVIDVRPFSADILLASGTAGRSLFTAQKPVVADFPASERPDLRPDPPPDHFFAGCYRRQE